MNERHGLFEVLSDYIDLQNLEHALEGYGNEGPFEHCVIDNFFDLNVAKTLEAEFPSFSSDVWHEYKNAVEVKKASNSWNAFPPTTYNVFFALNSPEFRSLLSKKVLNGEPLHADHGLNGGGWHVHGRGGKLNPHLDYSLHPKLGLQRRLNLIVYLNANWQEFWGGSLGLWGNETPQKPGPLQKSIAAKFNRAVIFDTTQNSWHGLPDPILCPEGEYRRSLAVYYLCAPPRDVEKRGKALFAPTEDQQDDPEILDLIRKRSDVNEAATVYNNATKPGKP